MTECKPRKQRRDPPLKVNIVYAPPSREGDEAWLRALKILMETEPEPKEEHDGEQPGASRTTAFRLIDRLRCAGAIQKTGYGEYVLVASL